MFATNSYEIGHNWSKTEVTRSKTTTDQQAIQYRYYYQTNSEKNLQMHVIFCQNVQEDKRWTNK